MDSNAAFGYRKKLRKPYNHQKKSVIRLSEPLKFLFHLKRKDELCVHLSSNFCSEVFILLLKTFTCLETNKSFYSDLRAVCFRNLCNVSSYSLFSILSFYVYLVH